MLGGGPCTTCGRICDDVRLTGETAKREDGRTDYEAEDGQSCQGCGKRIISITAYTPEDYQWNIMTLPMPVEQVNKEN